MAFAKEILSSSLIDRSSLISTSRSLLLSTQHSRVLFSPRSLPAEKKKLSFRRTVRVPKAAISEELVKSTAEEKPPVKFKVRAVVTVRNKSKEDLKETIVKHFDALSEKIGRNVVLELISTELDPRTKKPKSSSSVVKDWLEKSNLREERIKYTAEFMVDSSFGTPGAITITNKHQKEFFLETIMVEGFPCGRTHFVCNSWVQSTRDHPGKRIFFSNVRRGRGIWAALGRGFESALRISARNEKMRKIISGSCGLSSGWLVVGAVWPPVWLLEAVSS